MMRRLYLTAALGLGMGLGIVLASGADAQSVCGVYKVRPGDTLFTIAQERMGDQGQWSRLYYANQSVFAQGMMDLPEGLEITIPCAEDVVQADATPLRVVDAEMKLITGSNYAPFTDRSWLGQGMVTELVNASLEEMPSPVTYSIAWEDDWSQHLSPILSEKQADMGFPWLKPDCEATPDNERCAKFHYSDPLIEMLVLLFTRADKPLEYDADSDLRGKRLCRPKGYFTHDLDRSDRRWLSEGYIDLVQPDRPEDCFDLLMRGKVDAVSVNEFLGLTKISELGLQGQVVPVRRPLSVEGLHVIISKSHWRGTAFLYRFNTGLSALKESPRYDEIVSRHLGIFWESVN